jgi:N-formylmaleamate deformylase
LSPQWHSAQLETNGIHIHYTRTGGGHPALVLCHGFTDNGLCWTRLTRRLEDAYDVIMVDARGHGLSDAPESGYAYDDHAADVAGLIRQLELGEPAIIGHSMGAVTAATVAADYPGLVNRVVLEDPPWWASSTVRDLEAAKVASQAWRKENLRQKSQTRRELIAQGRRERPTWADAEWGPWVESKIQVSMSAFDGLAPQEEPWQDLVSRINCPILLVTADTELGALVTAETAEEAAGLWQQGQVVHIPGAGHNIRREQFEPFLTAVTAFLSEP